MHASAGHGSDAIQGSPMKLMAFHTVCCIDDTGLRSQPVSFRFFLCSITGVQSKYSEGFGRDMYDFQYYSLLNLA